MTTSSNPSWTGLRIFLVLALALVSGTIGLLLFAEKINPFVGVLWCTAMPVLGALIFAVGSYEG